jgi:hypothetical protein
VPPERERRDLALSSFGFNFLTARLLVFIPYEAGLREENRWH